jgi:hypothetical protein
MLLQDQKTFLRKHEIRDYKLAVEEKSSNFIFGLSIFFNALSVHIKPKAKNIGAFIFILDRFSTSL